VLEIKRSLASVLIAGLDVFTIGCETKQGTTETKSQTATCWDFLGPEVALPAAPVLGTVPGRDEAILRRKPFPVVKVVSYVYFFLLFLKAGPSDEGSTVRGRTVPRLGCGSAA
jgi:hypothetical protein